MMEFNSLKKWAEGKNPLVAMVAQQAVSSATSCFELCKLAENNELFSVVRQSVTPSVWLSFYRARPKTHEKAFKAYERVQPLPDELEDTVDSLLETCKREKRSKSSQSDEIEMLLKRISEFVVQYHYDTLNELSDFTELESLMQNSPEFVFLFRVSMPCQLLWSYPVTRLYREARLGKPQSLGGMIWLDPITRQDKRIREQEISILRHGGEDAEILRRELENPAIRKITLANMKVLIAGQISALSLGVERAMNNLAKAVPGMKARRIRLQEPEIRALFDAVALDFDDEDIDTDLPEAPEAFQKAILRARKFWPKY